jgi:NADH dehydrogenase FAD-containing subunit
MPSKKNVVLVGGGGSGAKLARALSEKLDATKYNLSLISAHPFYIHYIAGLRLLVTDEGSLENQMLIPYDKLFVNNNGRFKQGSVTAIEPAAGSQKGGMVVLESGETVDYDVLVLAPGSKWESLLNLPFDREKVQSHVEEWREKFRGAQKIAIAGGGAVGIGESLPSSIF